MQMPSPPDAPGAGCLGDSDRKVADIRTQVDECFRGDQPDCPTVTIRSKNLVHRDQRGNTFNSVHKASRCLSTDRKPCEIPVNEFVHPGPFDERIDRAAAPQFFEDVQEWSLLRSTGTDIPAAPVRRLPDRRVHR